VISIKRKSFDNQEILQQSLLTIIHSMKIQKWMNKKNIKNLSCVQKERWERRKVMNMKRKKRKNWGAWILLKKFISIDLSRLKLLPKLCASPEKTNCTMSLVFITIVYKTCKMRKEEVEGGKHRKVERKEEEKKTWGEMEACKL
jgi:hypothetical protein